MRGFHTKIDTVSTFLVGHSVFRRALDHPFYSGNSRCIDAFTVALNQACPEGEKRWSLSTLERQPLSFSFKKLPKRGEEKLWYTSTLELQGGIAGALPGVPEVPDRACACQ